MNAATAAGFLGGDVSVVTAIKKPKEVADRPQETGTCEFARISTPAAKLRIEVAIMQRAPHEEFAGFLDKCRSNLKPLKAIGNEAVVCSWDVAQRVVGRVRDQAFIVTLTAPDASVDKISKAAEVVAGNLF
jgi:hypothetical protein